MHASPARPTRAARLAAALAALIAFGGCQDLGYDPVAVAHAIVYGRITDPTGEALVGAPVTVLGLTGCDVDAKTVAKASPGTQPSGVDGVYRMELLARGEGQVCVMVNVLLVDPTTLKQFNVRTYGTRGAFLRNADNPSVDSVRVDFQLPDLP